MMKRLIMALLAAFSLLPCAGSAFAHGLNVFAWLENDQILVQSDFGRDRPAANAQVTIYDQTNHQKLLTGTTNTSGRFAFDVPSIIRQGHGILIDVNAGQGHRGEWAIDASEVYSAASLTAGFDEAALNSGQSVQGSTAGTLPMPQGAATSAQVQHIVQEALELKLAPIRQQLAAKAGPSIVEIIGGIGWILGLVGIGLYFKSRRS